MPLEVTPPIKVRFVIPGLSVGGAERHVVTLLPKMNPAKFTSSVVCIGEEGELFPALALGGIGARALHLGGARNAFRALTKLISLMRLERPDVVVLFGYNAETLGRIAALVTGVKRTVVWVHNMGDIEPRGSLRKVLQRGLDRLTSSFFGVAEAQRPLIVNDRRCRPDRVQIIRNGVDTALFPAQQDRSAREEFGFCLSDPVVGIVAALRPEKDHVTFLRAARIVVNELPRARFLIVGDGPARADLESLSAELGIEENVHFTGTRHDIARLLGAIDVFALSSFTVECFPMALLEAMASARPAVCTNVGGVGEMILHGDTGYLVPAHDHRSLATRLVELLRNPDAARRMGLAGRHRVESEFSLQRSVEGAEQAIINVMGDG